MSSVNLLVDISRLKDFPDMPVIEILANDGKITANRISLLLASSAVHGMLLENPDLTILDMKKSKKTTIDSLLRLINDGKTKFNNEVEEKEVISLAKDLGIEIIQLASTGKNIKVEAPIVPEEGPKDEDPGLMELNDGSFRCGLCFKAFPRKYDAKWHYQNIHMTKGEKNFSCRLPGCDKKFANEKYMKKHMRKSHGIPGRIIPSTSKLKIIKQSLKKPKEPSKKLIAVELQNVDVKEESANMMEESIDVKEESIDVKEEPIEG